MFTGQKLEMFFFFVLYRVIFTENDVFTIFFYLLYIMFGQISNWRNILQHKNILHGFRLSFCIHALVGKGLKHMLFQLG